MHERGERLVVWLIPCTGQQFFGDRHGPTRWLGFFCWRIAKGQITR